MNPEELRQKTALSRAAKAELEYEEFIAFAEKKIYETASSGNYNVTISTSGFYFLDTKKVVNYFLEKNLKARHSYGYLYVNWTSKEEKAKPWWKFW